MKNLHKNENFAQKIKEKGEMTPPPHLNRTMSSLGAVSHHQHTKRKKIKSKHKKNKNHQKYTQAKTLSQKHNLTQNNNTITNIYKLTPPKTKIDQTNNTTNHNTIKIHKNTKMVIIANNGSTTSICHRKMITNQKHNPNIHNYV